MRNLLVLAIVVWSVAQASVSCPLLNDIPADSIGGQHGRGCHYMNPNNGDDFWVWIPGHRGHPEEPACADPGIFN